MSIECYVTEFGFQYGAASVQREHRDEKRGFVQLGIRTPRSYIQVYVTKTGKIRVFGKKGAEMRCATTKTTGESAENTHKTCGTCRHWDGYICTSQYGIGGNGVKVGKDDFCSRHEAKKKQP